jgi:ATP-dependent RNA helicase DDX20
MFDGHLSQVMAFSATFTPELLADVEPLMKRPQKVMLCESEERVSLKGVRQFYQVLGEQGQQQVRAPL